MPLHDRLNPRQQALLDEWLPGARVVRDHSWGLVLHTKSQDRDAIVKATRQPGHLANEFEAHARWLTVWSKPSRPDAAAR